MLLTKFAAAIAATASLLPLGASALVLSRQGELLEPLVPAEATWSWTDCGTAEDPVQVKTVDIIAEIEAGQGVTIKFGTEVSKEVEEGAYADVTVKLGLVKLLQKRFDICQEAREADATVRCPVAPGSHTIEQKVKLPKEIPKAEFTINVRGFTVEDDNLLCVDIKASFSPKAPGLGPIE